MRWYNSTKMFRLVHHLGQIKEANLISTLADISKELLYHLCLKTQEMMERLILTCSLVRTSNSSQLVLFHHLFSETELIMVMLQLQIIPLKLQQH